MCLRAPRVELRQPSPVPFARTVRRLALRIGPALVLLAASVLIVIAGSWAFSVWVLIFGVLMAREWYAIAYQGKPAPHLPLHILCLAIVLGAVTAGYPLVGLGVLAAGTLAAMVVTARARLDPTWSALGVLYTVGPLACLVWLRMATVHPIYTVLWLLCVVWATDTAALVAGRLIGGPPLAPKISPRKTWAGLIGGAAAAAAVGFGAGRLDPSFSSLALMALSAILAVVAQLGDLTESAFKRRFGVKDSSQLIPGQGGVLDRVDGLVFATLTVTILAVLMGGSVLSVGAHP